MNNREVYSIDPSQQKLVNEGVANVNDDRSVHALNVLRYELQTFVCDGRYQDGLERILDTFLRNLNQAQQPAVWVSGFYGSGKSHLVKMLRALWENTEFPDGKKARDIADLPQSVRDYFAELTGSGRRAGGLHAASGTLGAGASGSVRLALLRVIFKSVGLPHQYPQARFVLWLAQEGLLNDVRLILEQNGYDWEEELENFYVAGGLHQALVSVKPNIFPSAKSCADTLSAQYRPVSDITIDDMVRTIKQSLSRDGVLPLTLIVLDEVQQYIGESSERSIDVQESVEACCKNIGSNLLFIGTGQTAVTGTSNLKKLEGRFTVRVELSDTDVDAVIRKVVLAKKPSSKPSIEKVMGTNIGEISRHLANTTLGHRQTDTEYFAQDYPILPVRRRFWESTLRVLDQTGTDSQLRNQLSMVHKAIQTNLDAALGSVIPADYIYFDSADKLLQAHVLPRKVYERTMTWVKGSPDERLMARATGMVFLVNKLVGSNNELGIKADADTIADLLVEDLNAGSSALRGRLTEIMDRCELLMKVGDEYRIQTEESTAWNDEFQSQRSQLANESHMLEADRNTRIRQKFGELVPSKNLTINHGNSKTPRAITATFETQLPTDGNERIYVWVRDGWSVDEDSVKADARAAGHNAPTIYVFVPSRSADDLRAQLISYKAASATLNKRGNPNTPEGVEARSAIQTIQQKAEGRIRELLGEAFTNAKVFKGGGDEVFAVDLPTAIRDAAESALTRLYPQFSAGDNEGWAKVYTYAARGMSDALMNIGFNGELADQPVCRQIQQYIGAGKKGSDIRNYFEASPYGWPQDTIDGGLQVLLVGGTVRAQDERGQTVAPQDLERKQIGKTTFKIESTTITKPQLIQIRKVFQQAGFTIRPDEEKTRIGELLKVLEKLADSAGGDAPRPLRPTSAFLEPIRISSGNEQLMALYERRDDITNAINEWRTVAGQIEQRLPLWDALQELMRHAADLPAADPIRTEAHAIVEHRLLLDTPDPIRPLGVQLETLLRDALVGQQTTYNDTLNAGWDQLEADASWKAISKTQQQEIAQRCEISALMELQTGSYEGIINVLEHYSLNSWKDRIDALTSRFARAREEAARLLTPKAQPLNLPRQTIHDEAELDAWLANVKSQIKTALGNGPVILK
ncbi:MAG: BREX system P-loop protein BrxC [Phototrophicaceae bacterium]